METLGQSWPVLTLATTGWSDQPNLSLPRVSLEPELPTPPPSPPSLPHLAPATAIPSPPPSPRPGPGCPLLELRRLTSPRPRPFAPPPRPGRSPLRPTSPPLLPQAARPSAPRRRRPARAPPAAAVAREPRPARSLTREVAREPRVGGEPPLFFFRFRVEIEFRNRNC